MSIGRANLASEEYLFDEAIADGHALLGWDGKTSILPMIDMPIRLKS